MVDVLTKKQRSYNMSRVRGKNTKPELALRKLLFKNGMKGYRINYKLRGKPDIVFPKHKTVIFIDGCFWHKCPECFKMPETNKAFWQEKIDSNVKRDTDVNEKLKKDGWRVLRIWGHEIKKDINKCINKIKAELGNS